MTVAELITLIRSYARVTDSSHTDAQLLEYIKHSLYEIALDVRGFRITADTISGMLTSPTSRSGLRPAVQGYSIRALASYDGADAGAPFDGVAIDTREGLSEDSPWEGALTYTYGAPESLSYITFLAQVPRPGYYYVCLDGTSQIDPTLWSFTVSDIAELSDGTVDANLLLFGATGSSTPETVPVVISDTLYEKSVLLWEYKLPARFLSLGGFVDSSICDVLDIERISWGGYPLVRGDWATICASQAVGRPVRYAVRGSMLALDPAPSEYRSIEMDYYAFPYVDSTFATTTTIPMVPSFFQPAIAYHVAAGIWLEYGDEYAHADYLKKYLDMKSVFVTKRGNEGPRPAKAQTAQWYRVNV